MDEYLLTVLEQKDKLADELHSLNSEYARLKARLGMSEFQKEKLQAASRAEMRRSPPNGKRGGSPGRKGGLPSFGDADGGAAAVASNDQIAHLTAERDVMASRLTAANESVKTLTAQLAASRRTQVSRESERRRRKQVFRGEIDGNAGADSGSSSGSGAGRGTAAVSSSSSSGCGDVGTSEDADRKAEIMQLQDCLATQVEHTDKQATEIEQLKADLALTNAAALETAGSRAGAAAVVGGLARAGNADTADTAAADFTSPPLSPVEPDLVIETARLNKLLVSKEAALQDANVELEMLRSLMGSGDGPGGNAETRAKELEVATELGAAQKTVVALKLEGDALREELAAAQEELATASTSAIAEADAHGIKVRELTAAVTEATKRASDQAVVASSASDTVQAAKNEVSAAQAVAAEYLEAATVSKEHAQQAEALFSAEQLRRRALHNKLVELCGNIRVHVKVRPLFESGAEPPSVVVIDDAIVEAPVQGKMKPFEFDRIYNQDTTSETVFNEVKSLVGSFVDGYNTCIMAYGQTGSGKTHTMLGPSTNSGLSSNLDGVIPRSVSEIFQLAEADSDNATFSFAVSVLEVYNEAVRDLLSETPDEKHDVTEGSGTADVPTALQCSVSDAEEVVSLVKKGMSCRVERSTDMNAHSSRSHLIVTVHCVRTAKRESLGMTTASRMHLVDLAGSENAKMAGHDLDGQALVEGRAINRSLSALADVLTALSSSNSKQHVPYRNSRLTHLLKDSIGGDAKMLMIVCLSPGSTTLAESIQSLRFGTRARAVEKGPATKKIVAGAGLDSKGKGSKK